MTPDTVTSKASASNWRGIVKSTYAPFLFVGLSLFCPANAQVTPQVQVATPNTAVAAQPQAIVIGGPAPSQLNEGTQFAVRLVRELTTKDKLLHVGDRFDLETVDPIKLGTVTVFPAGTIAVGEITFVQNKGMWGKSGKFQARLLFMRFGGRDFRITGQFSDKGSGGGLGAAATSAFIFLPAGFFMTGKSGVIPAGAIVTAYLGETVPVVVAPSAQHPAPVMVPADGS